MALLQSPRNVGSIFPRNNGGCNARYHPRQGLVQCPVLTRKHCNITYHHEARNTIHARVKMEYQYRPHVDTMQDKHRQRHHRCRSCARRPRSAPMHCWHGFVPLAHLCKDSLDSANTHAGRYGRDRRAADHQRPTNGWCK